MNTTYLPKNYESALKIIEAFAKNIFAGNDENQKKDLHQNLLVLAKLYTPSNMIKKRLSDSDINIHVEKETKFEPFEFEIDGVKNQFESKSISKFEPNKVETDANQVEKNFEYNSGKTVTLPEEVWLKIINYLKTKDMFLNFGLVSKFFNGLTLDSRAVKYLELANISYEKIFNQVLELIKRSNHIKVLQIKSIVSSEFDPHEIYWNRLMCQALKSSNLKSIKILLQRGPWSNERLAFKDAQEIVRYGKYLEKLEINKYIFLDDGQLDEISKITTLKSLKIGCLSIKSLVDIAQNCKQLEKISIFKNINDRGSRKILHKRLREAFDTFFKERSDTLKEFRIEEIEIGNLFQNINLCQNLEKLAIKVEYLKENNCDSIIQLKGLKELVIWSCDFCKNNSLNKLMKRMDVSKLKSLMLCDKGDREGTLFETISNMHFPVLERLVMHSSGYSDKAVETLLKNCPNLKSAQLYVSSSHIFAHESFSESISINTLVDYSIKNGIYIDFGYEWETMKDCSIYGNGRNLALLGTKLKEQDYPSWLKYQELKRNFEEWCDANQWSWSYKYHGSYF